MKVKEERLKKYQKQLKKDKHMKNQIVLRDGECVLVIDGEARKCSAVKGVVRFPGNKYAQDIASQNMVICILPNDRLIVECNDQYYLGGYKSENTTDFMLVVYAANGTDEVLVVWLDECEVPIINLLGDGETSDDNMCSILYAMFYNLMFERKKEDLGACEVGGLTEEDDADEFE